MPPSPICTAARKPDGYNKAHLQEFGQVLQAWMISQIPGGAKALDQLVCDGKTPRGSAVESEEGNHRFVAHVTVYTRAHGVALAQKTYDTHKSSERAALKELLGKLGLDDALIQADTLHTTRPFFDGAWSCLLEQDQFLRQQAMLQCMNLDAIALESSMPWVW